ncbi:Bcl-2-like protein 1 [Larimichthys crocea]|uniref:Uncharacterized protein n=1 Tax=Larimichthys crocea TaxID=215358 RepID=A0ACD3R903_LARCR|nr:Bcl-2-like protein 1 [Larimichthys crocea]
MISVGGDVGLASLRIMLGKNVSDNNGSAGLMGCRRGEGRSEHARERFAEIFGQDAAAEGRRSQESFKKWLLAGMTLVTGVVVGSLIAQKRL